MNKHRNNREASFTLFEAVIALALLSFLILEVGGVQGNAIVFSDYSRKVGQATWLAKRIMAQIEYHVGSMDLKDLETEVKETPFEDYKDYSYAITIKEWKFPVMELLTGGVGKDSDEEKKGGGGEESKDQGPMAGMGEYIKTAMSQIFNDTILKTAYVEVSWPEGAKKNSTGLTMLLTNQRDLDKFLGTMKGAVDQAKKAGGGTGTGTSTNTSTNTNTNTRTNTRTNTNTNTRTDTGT